MNAESKGLQINIMGREFRVACPEEEQKGLLEAVEYLNRKMQEIRAGGKVLGVERIAIMAALNIAHELLTTKVGGGFDIADIKRKMARMENVLDQLMSDQDELFYSFPCSVRLGLRFSEPTCNMVADSSSSGVRVRHGSA